MIQIKKIFNLTFYQMKSRYRNTFAGVIWVIASPLLTFVVQSLVFKEIFKLKIDQYPVYLLSGLLPWFFISQTFYSSITCLVNSREVLLAFKIGPFSIVAANVLDQFISFLAAFLIIAGILIVPDKGHFSGGGLIALPLNLVSLFCFVLFLNYLLSFWYAFYRDINFITNFILGLIFYITPIFFVESMFPEKFNWILKFNFLIPFIKIFQTSLYAWTPEVWRGEFLKTIAINIALIFLIKLSHKLRFKDFYVCV